MSEIITSSGIDIIRGKFQKSDAGYFYIRNGKQFYRTRVEDYQKNQSPRQKWNSAAFKCAHQQLHILMLDPASVEQLNADYEASKHIASNGKSYTTLRAWKFNSLLHEYKQSHPFE